MEIFADTKFKTVFRIKFPFLDQNLVNILFLSCERKIFPFRSLSLKDIQAFIFNF